MRHHHRRPHQRCAPSFPSPLADLQLTRSPSLQELMGHDLYTPTAWSQQSVPSQAGSMADGDIAMEQLKTWHPA